MASLIFNSGLNDIFRGNVNPAADAFKAMLCTSAFVPDKDTQTRRSDITNEVVGTGYSSGGTTAALTVTNDTVNNRIDVALGAVSWDNSTITARYAVYYKSRGGAASADELVAVIDFGADFVSTNGPFSLTESTLRIQN